MAYIGRIRQLQGGTTDGSTHLDCPWPVKYSGASMGVIYCSKKIFLIFYDAF